MNTLQISYRMPYVRRNNEIKQKQKETRINNENRSSQSREGIAFSTQYFSVRSFPLD
jgi:hypothetical protein